MEDKSCCVARLCPQRQLAEIGLNLLLGRRAGDASEFLFQPTADRPSLMRLSRFLARTIAAPADSAAAAVIVVLIAVALFTYDDYGLGWDDHAPWRYGELLFSY